MQGQRQCLEPRVAEHLHNKLVRHELLPVEFTVCDFAVSIDDDSLPSRDFRSGIDRAYSILRLIFPR